MNNDDGGSGRNSVIPLEPVRLEDHGYDCGFSERYGS